MAEGCNVDEAFPSVSGFGCGSGSGSPINLWPVDPSDSSGDLLWDHSGGDEAPQEKFMVMGTTAQPLVLGSMTPAATTTVAVATVVKARLASLVVRLVASLVQGMS